MIKKRIRLIVADIDGCLSKGSANPIPLRLIERLVGANERSRTDPDVPAVTFCTGRPQPYVECLVQSTAGYMPALCEGGTVFFEPVKYEITTHPNFGTHEKQLLEKLKAEVASKLHGSLVKPEAGKITHITLILSPPLKPGDLLDAALKIADKFGGEIIVETTRVCIHFLFKNLNKGTGITWLAEHTGIAPLEMGGVGDARPDLPFLSMMGVACAPANAHLDVKNICGRVSCREDSEATIEFLDYVIASNRALREGSEHALASA